MQSLPSLVAQSNGVVGVVWHRSCYVGVPPSHPRLRVLENHIRLNVVGGITWLPSKGIPPIIEEFPVDGISDASAYAWFGWDHNHFLSRAEEREKMDVPCDEAMLIVEIKTAINELEKQ